MPSKNNRIHKLYGIVTGVSAIVAGICLIAACLHIYRSGVAADAAQIYTRQIVAESFAKIAVPVYVCLALVLGGVVLNLVLPTEKPRLKPEKNLPLILSRLHEKTDLASCDEQLRNAITKEQKRRKDLGFLTTFAQAMAYVNFWDYATEPEYWGANSTPSMVKAVTVLLIFLAIPFALAVFTVYRSRKSMATEIELMRQAAAQAPKSAEKAEVKTRSSKPVNIARIAILAAAVLLVVLGVVILGVNFLT